MKHVDTLGLAAPLGPYSHAKVAGGLVFCAGHLALDPNDGSPEAALDAEQQTRVVLQNLERTLNAAGVALEDVVRTTIYLSDLDDYASMNAAYLEAFGTHRPARATVEVSGLLGGLRVEIEAIADATGLEEASR